MTSIGGFALYLINWHGWTAFILWVIYSNWSESTNRSLALAYIQRTNSITFRDVSPSDRPERLARYGPPVSCRRVRRRHDARPDRSAAVLLGVRRQLPARPNDSYVHLSPGDSQPYATHLNSHSLRSQDLVPRRVLLQSSDDPRPAIPPCVTTTSAEPTLDALVHRRSGRRALLHP